MPKEGLNVATSDKGTPRKMLESSMDLPQFGGLWSNEASLTEDRSR